MANRRDGGKPSFAELDRRRRERRSGSGDSRDRDAGPGSPQASLGQKSYRAVLERAFAEGKVDELAAKLAGARAVSPAVPEPPPAAATETAPPAATASVPADPQRAEKRDLLTAIRSAETADQVGKAIDRWRTRFGDLPADAEVLEKALAHRDPAVVRSALESLDRLIAASKPRRTRSLVIQLSIVEDTSADDDITGLARKLRTALA